MDDYFFKNHVKACRNVIEDTSYLEIFNYSVCDCLTNSPRTHTREGGECLLRADHYQDPSYNTVEQHPLTMDEFDNFLKRKVRISRGGALPASCPEAVISYLPVSADMPSHSHRAHSCRPSLRMG